MQFGCLHPVKCKVDGIERLVPCGKCSFCLHARSESWVRRLKVESSQHKYVYFGTLSYNDRHVPHFKIEEIDDWHFQTDDQRNSVIDYFISFPDSRHEFLSLCYYDIQLFLKRLRSYIYDCKQIPSWQKGIRYFFCGEYGPSTHRPHYHFLLFLDNDWLCTPKGRGRITPIETFVRKAWRKKVEDKAYWQSMGFITFERVRDNAASYCSKYVTSVSDLPKVLQLKAFRPFSQASKSPSIGSFEFDVEQAKKIVTGGYNEFVNTKGSDYDGNISVPLWKSLKDNLFPKIIAYNSLSFDERVRVYGLASFPYVGASYSEFREFLYGIQDTKNGLVDFVLKIIDAESIGSLYQINKRANASLVRIHRQSARVLFNCGIMNLSLSQYVSYIDRFYKNCDYELLKKQLEFEEKFVKVQDSRFLASFVDATIFSKNGKSRDLTLEGFGFTSNDDFALFDFRTLDVYKNYAGSIEEYVRKGKSYKRKSDYVINSNFNNLTFLENEFI